MKSAVRLDPCRGLQGLEYTRLSGFRVRSLVPIADALETMSEETAFDGVLRAARAGADWAWRDLYEDIAPKLTGYARASGAADPEDVVGDVFLRAVVALERFEGDRGDFRTWMFTLARNRIIDGHRKLLRRKTEPMPLTALGKLGPMRDAEQEAMQALARERALAAMAPLTPDQRQVLLLRILADLTIEEVALVLGKRPGAVKALQARALARLRRGISIGAVSL